MGIKATTIEVRVCDRPGCGKRVTDKGTRVTMTNGALVAVADDEPHGVDLCRACGEQMSAFWERKAEAKA